MNWFRGPDVDEPSEQEFLAALRSAAESGVFAGLDPASTSFDLLAEPSEPGVAVAVAVPKLTTRRRWLLVSYQPRRGKGAPMLRSEWSSEAILNSEPGAYDGPGNDNDLWVSGIPAGPDQCAVWAVDWISRQLQRPVTRREWDQPATGPGAGIFGKARAAAAVEWSLAEPEEYLDSHGTFGRWRLTRQPPTREIHERP